MMRSSALYLMLLFWPVLIPRLPASPLRAGVAAVEITPPIGTKLAGFAKGRLAKGVHDSLSAKVLVLRTSETSVALVASDLYRLQSPSLVNRIHDELGITHTICWLLILRSPITGSRSQNSAWGQRLRARSDCQASQESLFSKILFGQGA
jgi:hypothetical protein